MFQKAPSGKKLSVFNIVFNRRDALFLFSKYLSIVFYLFSF